MTNLELGIYSLPVLLLLIFLRMPIGLAMLAVGMAGTTIAMGGPIIVLAQLKGQVYTTFSNYSLSIVPLFLLMGQFATLGGMSQALFKAAEAFLGHRKGGVAMASVGACAGFGAICGSSLATAATMGQVALPELKRYGYSGGLSTATLAAGGTLGILIPPSVVLVIYAILTEQNIAKLFVAAFIPGLLAAIGYMIVIRIIVAVSPGNSSVMERLPWAQRLVVLSRVWPVLLVFGLVVGGIYFGWFTPTEAAAIGCAGTGLIALFGGGLTWATLTDAIMKTAQNTAMIFLIILGAGFYNAFLALTHVPQEMSSFVVGLEVSPWTILVVILCIYLIFGCVMDSLSMILLTVPIFFPIVSTLDFGLTPEETALWFGIIVLIVVEVGLITPPVGMNLFVISAMDRTTSIVQTYKYILPFVASDIVRTAILVAFPAITLGLMRVIY
ncbi:MAG: TRAP transporter large permease [Rhodobacteraceae bacterium]|nr:TRAP transporter large permease [Paracoccaceae bacterium]